MPVNRWWASSPEEHFFLETTDRPDIGVDLKAPQATDNGQTTHAAYSLISSSQPPDTALLGCMSRLPAKTVAQCRWRPPGSGVCWLTLAPTSLARHEQQDH
jgi:hypothetical protein